LRRFAAERSVKERQRDCGSGVTAAERCAVQTVLVYPGRQVYIDHPDFVSASKNEELVTGFDMSGGVEIVDLMLVVSLRYGPKLAPTSQ